MLLYSLLHLTGYALPLEQIKQFRQWGSMTPGHPERGLTPGVETTTGPLGQGFGNGVGMAMAEAHLAARYNRPGFEVIDHHTYGIVSDGDLMEGIASEAASLAGHLRLGKLIYLYDDNHVTLSAGTPITFTEDCARRFAAYGWHTQARRRRKRPGGDRARAAPRARGNAAAVPDSAAHPSRLWLAAQAGHVPGARFAAGRGRSALDEGESGLAGGAAVLRSGAGARAFSRRRVERGERAEAEWNDKFSAYAQAFPELAAELQQRMRGELPAWLGCGDPRLPGRRQRHGHPRRLGQDHERRRAAPAGADRRFGRPGSVDPHRAQGIRRLRAARSPPPATSRVPTAAVGRMPAAICISACASMPWVRS